MTLTEIQGIVAAVDSTARHYYSDKKGDSYTVWHEYRRLTLQGDNQGAEIGWAFQIDRFTKTDNDAVAAAFCAALDANDRITFEHLTSYEPDTGYIHHIFDCEGV